MEAYNFFLNDEGHLRSGWRLAIFAIAFLVCVQVAQVVLFMILNGLLHLSYEQIVASYWSVALGHGSILFSGLLVGWACGRLLEELPLPALGCTPHQGWLKNFGLGSALGTASMLLAAMFATLMHGIQFRFDPAGGRLIGQTLLGSLCI